VYDDGYNPAQTVQLTNKLILEDKVFAIVGSLGTEHNQAIRPLLNQRKIPQILVSTGASTWGAQHAQFPWTIGWQPSYITEGKAYGTWLRKNAPNKKIAIFYQNDDYGKGYVEGVKRAIQAMGGKVALAADVPHEVQDRELGAHALSSGTRGPMS
jgi:branched-chain amino acid transport system substrate-binding protein